MLSCCNASDQIGALVAKKRASNDIDAQIFGRRDLLSRFREGTQNIADVGIEIVPGKPKGVVG